MSRSTPDAYADDDPDQPAEVEPDAVPGRRPKPVAGPDDLQLIVDGETWLVRRRGSAGRTLAFDWLSHPYGYGFGSSANTDRQPSEDELIRRIRAFMAEVDPETGYLPAG